MSEAPHECDICERTFDTQRGLSVHESRGHSEIYQDQDKMYEFLIEKDLTAAELADRFDTSVVTIRNWKEKLGIVGGVHDCPECDQGFNTRQGLGQHLSRVHGTTLKKHEREGEYECPSCDRSFKNRLALGTHHGKVHGESLKEYERRIGKYGDAHTCPICSLPFNSRQALGTHYGRSHDYDGPLKEKIARELAEFAKGLGRTPMAKDANDPSTDIWTQNACHDRFGSWNAALRAAGLELNGDRNVSSDRLQEELRFLAAEMGRTPFTTDMSEMGSYSYWLYTERYDSWANACKAAGLEPPTFLGQNNPNWRGGKSVYDAVKKQLGPISWQATVAKYRESRCRQCGSDDRVDLHHIVPILAGGNHGERNFMTLCRGCHSTAEGFIRQHTEPVIRDYLIDELPDNRKPSEEYIGSLTSTNSSNQTELTDFEASG